MERPRFSAPATIDGERYDQYFHRLVTSFEDYVNAATSTELVTMSCDCDCGTACPQGKIGSSSRCTIMVRP